MMVKRNNLTATITIKEDIRNSNSSRIQIEKSKEK